MKSRHFSPRSPLGTLPSASVSGWICCLLALGQFELSYLFFVGSGGRDCLGGWGQEKGCL